VRGTSAASAPVHHEHRAGQLGAALEVEDAEGLADVPVRDALVLAVAVGVVALDADDHVVGLALPVGGVVGGEVGEVEEHVAQPLRGGDGQLVELLLLAAELAALLLELARLVLPSVAEELADFVGDRADLRPQLVTGRAQPAELGIELDDLVDLGQVLATTGQARSHHVGLGPEAAHVEHGRSR
jgi:hypothetical protein